MKKLLLSILIIGASLGLTNAQTSILTQDFEGTGLPTGWSIITNATDGGYKFGANTVIQSTSFPITAHTKMAGTNDDACNCDKSNDILSTPSMDLSTFTTVFLSYEAYYFKLSYQGIQEEAKIVASTDGGLTWTDVVTLDANANSWQTNYADLSAFAGNANVKVGFKYNDNGGWVYGLAIDDVSIFSPLAGTDLSLTATLVGKNDPRPVFTGYTKYLTGLPLSVQTTVTNNGTIAITSFDYSWTDGVNVNNQSITGVNIAPLSSYSFTSTAPYVTLAGATTISTTISNINNGAVELSTANNSGTFSVNGVVAHPDKKYVAEEGTGTWCQWCPRGAVFMDYMAETYPDQFVGIAVHNADPMVVTAYDAGIGGLIGGYPSVVPNRLAEIDPSELEGDFLNYISIAPDAVVGGTATLNLSNNQITIDLSTTFNSAFTGDYRFVAVVMEDSVTGTGSTYNQSNAYGNNANGPMGGFETFGTSVPAASMNYNHVARALLGTFAGQTGSIPSTVIAGTPYTYSFTTNAVTTWDKAQLHIAAMVINAGTGDVVNAVKLPVTITTSVKEQDNLLAGSYVYPSVTSDLINLSLNLTKNSDVVINITDVTGKVVLNQNLGTMNKGINKMFYNVGTLSSGMYHLTAITPEGKIAMKFVRE